METNELKVLRELSDKSFYMFSNSDYNKTLIDEERYVNPYFKIDLDDLSNWVPVVLRLCYYSSGKEITYYPALMRAKPNVVNNGRCTLNDNIVSLSSCYIDDLEIVFNNATIEELIKNNLIESYIWDYKKGYPVNKHYISDKKQCEDSNLIQKTPSHVDIDIYPYYFDYKSYLVGGKEWVEEEKHIGIEQGDYSVLHNNGLGCYKLKNAILGEETFLFPIDIYTNGLKHVYQVSSIKCRILDTHYELVNLDNKKKEENYIDISAKFFEECKLTIDEDEAKKHTISLTIENNQKIDEISDDDLLL